MMNLSDIKGIIEINGESYDPKEVLRALLEQGLKIHPLNGSLLIGRTFIDPAPNLEFRSQSCPISTHCKIFEKLNLSKKEKTDSSLTSYDLDIDSQSPSSQSQSSPNKFYTDPVQMDIDNMDIQSLFSESTIGETALPYAEHQNSSVLRTSLIDNLEPEPAEMMGVSPVTKYGESMNIDVSHIPLEYKGRCP
ncbi:MAG: hypothetical protein H7644_03950, partial [Candidatus Heimdallarchaeota archaeon]|nr:hypothetical protein [Candidatus Heimdallarchaeota archaeon]MCK5142896.1 hypothetical protein [Candidatus Heimdallarchaeota archaeon]